MVGFAGPLVITGVVGGVGFAALAEPTPTATSASTRSPRLIYRNTAFAHASHELCWQLRKWKRLVKGRRSWKRKLAILPTLLLSCVSARHP